MTTPAVSKSESFSNAGCESVATGIPAGGADSVDFATAVTGADVPNAAAVGFPATADAGAGRMPREYWAADDESQTNSAGERIIDEGHGTPSRQPICRNG